MCRLWSVYSVNLLCEAKEASVLHVVRRDVIMIVPSLSVITEAVKVFNAQVQTLEEKVFTVFALLLVHVFLDVIKTWSMKAT